MPRRCRQPAFAASAPSPRPAREDCPQRPARTREPSRARAGSGSRQAPAQAVLSAALIAAAWKLRLGTCTVAGNCDVAVQLATFAPEAQITLGNCTAVLAPSESCVLGCDAGYENESSLLVTCGENDTLNPNLSTVVCVDCAEGAYKNTSGSDPCARCPQEGASTPERGAVSVDDCTCLGWLTTDSKPYAQYESGTLMRCSSCPDNAHQSGSSDQWNNPCVCDGSDDQDEDEMLVPNVSSVVLADGTSWKVLVACREPYPCNVRDLVFPLLHQAPGRLLSGTCQRYLNGLNGSVVGDGMLASGQSCRLDCPTNYAEQYPGDLVSSIDMWIRCYDGNMTGPAIGVFCSENAFFLPPLVFICMVTVTTAISGCKTDFRQRNFRWQTQEALVIRDPPAYLVNPSSRKVKAA